MSRRMFWPVVLAMGLGSMGCMTIDSLNVQKSLLRGTGDNGITAVLENQDANEVDEIVKGVKDICNDVLMFLGSGNISLLTKNQLKNELLDVVLAESADFVNDIVSLVSVTNVDLDTIGPKNVKRIRAFIKGVIRGADEYKVGDR